VARSSYIYLLVDTPSGEAVGAFTVKHEMMSARGRHPNPTQCVRYKDGKLDHGVDITKELP
jgi:hypothetical protein